MNIISINTADVVNGPGIRVSIFCSGCEFRCKDCHNQSAWDFNQGMKFTQEVMEKIKNEIAKDYIQGLSILGGEPLHPNNRVDILHLCKTVKDNFPNKDIYIWTGYTLEELLSENNDVVMEILKTANVLIDGRFEVAKRDITLYLRGSSNQRIINLNELTL